MPSKRWAFTIGNLEHVVVARWNRINNAGDVTVDGVVQDSWNSTANIESRRFSVAKKEAMVRWSNNLPLQWLLNNNNCELFLDGVRMPPAKAATNS